MLTGHFGQFGLLGQNFSADDWANLLFIVVMAVLWLGAGLVKTIGKKVPGQGRSESDGPAGQRRPGETWQERLARRAEELQRRLEEQATGTREPRRPTSPPRQTAPRPAPAPGGKITVRPGQRGESVVVYERPQTSPTQREHHSARQREAQETVSAAAKSAAAPKLASTLRETDELVGMDISPLVAEPAQPQDQSPVRKETPESTSPESASFIDYGNPDALRKAILHYEILGKPLALRDTLDQGDAF